MISRARLFSVLFSSLLIAACASDDEYNLMPLESDSTSSDVDDSASELLDDDDLEDDTVEENPIDDVESPDEQALPRRIGETEPQVVYINGEGRKIDPTESASSSKDGTSSLLDKTYTFPASKYRNTSNWDKMMAAVRKDFDAYNVKIVDQRPDASPYIEVIVSNVTGSFINYKEKTVGVSPISCRVLENTVAFVFDQRLRSPQSVANTVSHEAGHALSLSHTQTAEDLMSYVSKEDGRFVDRNAKCGTKPGDDQNCICKDSKGRRLKKQNNHQQLLHFVGPKRNDTDAPKIDDKLTLSTVDNKTTFSANSRITLTVDTRKITGLKDVALDWRVGTTKSTFECKNTPNIQCTNKNGIYTFSIVVGEGTRHVAAVATTSGGTLRSATKELVFEPR